jgi:hypothetical protein
VFSIGEAEKLAALDRIAPWIERPDLKAICVDRIARNGKQTKVRGSDIFPEVLEHFQEPREQAVLDSILLAHGDAGGTISIRASFEDGPGGPVADQKFRIGLVNRGAGTATGSKGPAAATEALATSITGMSDSLRRSHDELGSRFIDALQDHAGQNRDTFTEQLQNHHAYQSEILRLQLQVSNLEHQIRFMEHTQSTSMDAEQWAGLLKEVAPVAGKVLEGLIGAFSGRAEPGPELVAPPNGAAAPPGVPPEAPSV